MKHDFWNERWERRQIGFHEGRPNRFLLQYVDRLGPPGAVFVPLCGMSLDLDALAERGFRVTGCEFVERAALDFFRRRGEEATRRLLGDFEVFEGPSGVRIARGDVFDYTPEEGLFDAIFDRAALVAIAPDQRERYAAKLAGLLRPGGKVLLVSLEHDAGSGPPFDVDRTAVERLFAGAFTIEELSSEDILAESANIASKGATRVHERAYLLERR